MFWPIFRKSRDLTDCAHTRFRQSDHPTVALKRSRVPAGFEDSSANHSQGCAVRMPDDFGSAQSLAGLDPDLGNVIDCIADCHAPCGLVHCGTGLQTGSQEIIANARITRPVPFLTSFRTRERRSGQAMKRSAFMLRAGCAPSEQPRAKTVTACRQMPGSAFW